eukprot:TRINITY_DN1026_c0_g1_i2.p1 TRINITY_DN1026_c0_g1~~TRINITY_DN1026_c0_g1_i2.p1  ORF type:complete len:127 (-),score=34.71 TRINITY_DN1026_c0_g1_i2:102-482(-)
MSLERQLKDIESSKQVAVETIAELGRQEEQLKKIADDVQDIKEGLKHAVKQLRVIARNLAKDWIVRAFCFIVLVTLIVVIIVLAVLPKNKNKNPLTILTSDSSSIFYNLSVSTLISLIFAILTNLT